MFTSFVLQFTVFYHCSLCFTTFLHLFCSKSHRSNVSYCFPGFQGPPGGVPGSPRVRSQEVLKVGEGWGRQRKVEEGRRRLEKVGEGWRKVELAFSIRNLSTRNSGAVLEFLKLPWTSPDLLRSFLDSRHLPE